MKTRGIMAGDPHLFITALIDLVARADAHTDSELNKKYPLAAQGLAETRKKQIEQIESSLDRMRGFRMPWARPTNWVLRPLGEDERTIFTQE